MCGVIPDYSRQSVKSSSPVVVVVVAKESFRAWPKFQYWILMILAMVWVRVVCIATSGRCWRRSWIDRLPGVLINRDSVAGEIILSHCVQRSVTYQERIASMGR